MQTLLKNELKIWRKKINKRGRSIIQINNAEKRKAKIIYSNPTLIEFHKGNQSVFKNTIQKWIKEPGAEIMNNPEA